MQKVVYSMEQMQRIAICLESLSVTGFNNCRCITECGQIIDNPLETVEEEEGEK